MPPKYPADLMDAVAEALEVGVYYQNDLKDYVFDRLGGLGFTPNLVEEVEIDKALVDVASENAERRRIEAMLENAPRGAMVAMRYMWKGENGPKLAWHYYVATGYGEKPYFTNEGGNRPPTPKNLEAAAASMVGYDVYLCRQAIETEQQKLRDVEVVVRSGMTVGTKYVAPQGTAMRLGGKTWSSATISALDATSGQVTIDLARRGSASRYRSTIGATRFAQMVGMTIDRDADTDHDGADPCLVTTNDGRVYRFDRQPGSGFVMTCLDTGNAEHLETHNNAVWRLGKYSNGSYATGPDGFVRAWRLAVTRVFPDHKVRQPDPDASGPRI